MRQILAFLGFSERVSPTILKFMDPSDFRYHHLLDLIDLHLLELPVGSYSCPIISDASLSYRHLLSFY